MIHGLAIGVLYLHGDAGSRVFCAVRKLRSDADELIVASGDIQWMAVKVEVFRRTYDADVTEESTTSVPARVSWFTGVGNHLYQVVLAIFQVVGDIYLKTYVTIVCATHALQVYIDVGGIHNAFEVKEYTLTLHNFRWGVVQSVVALAHLLETAT